MNLPVVLPALTSILALVFSLALFDQWRDRRGGFQLIWAIGMLFYGVGAGCEAIAAASGWNEALYRTWYLTGAVWTAGWLGLGTAFLLGRTRFGYSFALCLFLAGLFTFLVRNKPEYAGAGTLPLLYFIAAGLLALAVAVETYFANERWPILAAVAVVGATVAERRPHGRRRPSPAPGYALDPATGAPVATLFPPPLRLLTPFMNITGAFALILGAIFSTYVFMPKRRVLAYSLDPNQPGDEFLFNLLIAPVAIPSTSSRRCPARCGRCSTGKLHSRVPATILIAIGAFVATLGGHPQPVRHDRVVPARQVPRRAVPVRRLPRLDRGVPRDPRCRSPRSRSGGRVTSRRRDALALRPRPSDGPPSTGPPRSPPRAERLGRTAPADLPWRRCRRSVAPTACPRTAAASRRDVAARPSGLRLRDRHRRRVAVRDARAVVAVRLRRRDGADRRSSPGAAGSASLATAVFVAWRIRRGAERADSARRPRRARLASASPSPRSWASRSTSRCSSRSISITVALALLGFYTYPVMVAVANVALGRETLDRPRVVALALAVAGMVAVVASQLDPAAGHPARCRSASGSRSARRSARRSSWSSAGRGYRQVPADAGDGRRPRRRPSVCGIVAAPSLTGGGSSLAYPMRDPSILPLLAFTGLFAAAIPSILFLTGIRLDRRDAGRDPDAVRAGRRRRAGGAAARRGPGADPGRRRAGDPRRGA